MGYSVKDVVYYYKLIIQNKYIKMINMQDRLVANIKKLGNDKPREEWSQEEIDSVMKYLKKVNGELEVLKKNEGNIQFHKNDQLHYLQVVVKNNIVEEGLYELEPDDITVDMEKYFSMIFDS